MEINKKRYNDIDSYFKRKFGSKVIKLPVDANFSCPNRDGTLSYGGCIFCSKRGSGDFTINNLSISEQLDYQKKILSKPNRDEKYIAYFQNFTNTYADVDTLRKIYYEALSKDYIMGIAIATRLDCIDHNIIELLKEIDKDYFLFVEFGLQSVDEDMIKLINRSYSHKEFDKRYLEFQKTGIKSLAHIIVGFGDDVDKTIDYVNERKFWGIKIHNLYVQKGTKLEQLYREKKIKISTKDEYVEYVCNLITHLDPKITIHRLTGDGPKDEIIAPLWSKNKAGVLSSIDRYLKIYNLRQGELYGK
ncbi:MAG: TIGR01212 family radical SAM protein [Tissierellia bacterium]|nr:TIGR01212 family radical SAM protein [Tissierellia bacterium]